jgi:SAM-dependent methyltransferase
MKAPPAIGPFKPRLTRLHRTRAAKGFADAAFLHKRVAEDLCERLEAIPRRFETVLALGAPVLFASGVAERPDLAARLGRIVFADAVAPLAPHGVACDPEFLPFTDESFDLVVSPLLLHWTNDLVGALIQIRRALRPDGLFLGALFAAGTLSELRAAFLQAESELRGGAGPRVAPFADLVDLAAVLQRAGFALPAADRDQIVVRYREPLELLRDLRAAGETNALAQRAGPLGRDTLFRAMEIYRATNAEGDRVRATFEIVTLTGWAPHESQQKPLEPGSAKMRLADAIGGAQAKPAGRNQT